MILTMILVRVCLQELDSTKCGLKYMLSLLSSHGCHGNFSAYSECFGNIIGRNPNRLSDVQYQNPPKVFRVFSEVLVANMAGNQASHVFQATNISRQLNAQSRENLILRK